MVHLIRSTFFIFFLSVANLSFAQDIPSILEEAPNQEAFWSISVRDVDGNVLEEFNSDKLIIPASNQKLFTTAAILDGLGSDFRFTTNIYGDGILEDSVWIGSLIIKGSGDPSISGFMYDGDREFVFNSFLKQIKEKGIRYYEGDIKVDLNYFDSQSYPKGWDWDDLSFYYGVEISPLSFNNNAVDLIVDAEGDIGDTPEISWFPEYSTFFEFINEQQIVEPNKEYDEFYRRDLGGYRIYLKSKLPQGYLEEESLSIYQAHAFFIDSFRGFLNSASITNLNPQEVYGENISVENQIGLKLLASHKSEPLFRLIEWTNKESDNFYTEMLLKTLAAEKAGIPGTFENGIQEVRNFLDRMEMDTTYVIMKDGSGMASGNFTKTTILSEFLVKMKDHPEFPAFFNSMSIAGIDGTIGHRMRGTPLQNNFKGKSGYVGGVRTLSGYVTTSSGKELIISMAANNFIGKVRPIDAVHERILAYLYEKY